MKLSSWKSGNVRWNLLRIGCWFVLLVSLVLLQRDLTNVYKWTLVMHIHSELFTASKFLIWLLVHSLSSKNFSFVTSVNLLSHHGKSRLLTNNTLHLFFLTNQQIYQLNSRIPSRRMFLLYSYYCSYSLRHHLLPLKPWICTLSTLWTFHWKQTETVQLQVPKVSKWIMVNLGSVSCIQNTPCASL